MNAEIDAQRAKTGEEGKAADAAEDAMFEEQKAAKRAII